MHLQMVIKEPYKVLASFPGPLRGGEKRAWYTLHAHALGTPQKSGVIVYYSLLLRNTPPVYFLRILPSILGCIDPPATGNHGDTAHARAMCTKPFSLRPSKKGLGTRLIKFKPGWQA